MSKTFDTLNLDNAGKGLGNLSELFGVLEELEIEESSEQWNTLLDVRRELLSTLDAEIKLNAASNKPKQCKFYFFNDMFIIGQYRKVKRKKNEKTVAAKTLKSVGTQDDFIFGEMVGRKLSSDEQEQLDNETGSQPSNDDNSKSDDMHLESSQSKPSKRVSRKPSASGASQPTAVTESAVLKIKLWMDLENVDVRKFQEGTEPGIRCSCTVQEAIEDPDTKEITYSTEVQQVQIFFTNIEDRDKTLIQLTNVVDTILENKIRNGSKFGDELNAATEAMTDMGSVNPDEASVDGDAEDAESAANMKKMISTMRRQKSDGTLGENVTRSKSTASAGTAGSKKRSYAGSKETMRKLRYNRNKKQTGTFGAEKFEAITLEDLVERYKVVLSPEQKDETAEFSVTFGPGPMGFALSSVKESDVGVFVGKLEAGGMAEIGGVTLGDRVLKVGDVDVSSGMSWKDVIEVIKIKRPEPKKLVVIFARAKSVEDNVAKKVEEERKKRIQERIKRKGNKREWAKRKAKSFGSRMASLSDVKDKYEMKHTAAKEAQDKAETVFDILLREDVAQSKAARKCAFILKEMFDTERTYLASLYVLVDSYMHVLEKRKIDVPCKEIQSKDKFCEHNVPRSHCTNMSTTKNPLLTKQELKALFGNVELLVKINENLMQSLQVGLMDLLKKHDETVEQFTVVDVVLIFAPTFSQIMPFFRIYSQYAFQYSNALETLNRLKEDDIFREELDKIESKRKTESLNSLLMKPIARLCKYPLLFTTLNESVQAFISELANEAAKTGKGDVDKLDKCLTVLLEASQIVADIAESVDVKVGTAQDLENLYDIYLELGGHSAVEQFMVPSRRFIGKYEVYLEDRNTKKSKLKPTWLYLFNDLVIFATEKNNNNYFGGGGRTGSFLQFKAKGKGTLDNKSDVDKQSKTSGSRVSASRRKTGKLESKQMVNVTKKVKIDVVNVRKKVVPNKEEMHGFSFTETERKVSLVKKQPTSKVKREKPELEEEQETNIYSYDIWLEKEEERDQLLASISDQVKAFKQNRRAKKKINAKLKPELQKKQRQWKSKARKLRQRSIEKLEASGQAIGGMVEIDLSAPPEQENEENEPEGDPEAGEADGDGEVEALQE